MTAVVLQPAGDAASLKHYVDTIQSPVPLASIGAFLSEKEQQLLGALYPNGLAPIWGVTPGKLGQTSNKWRRLEVGDVTLFSRNKRIVSSGVMTFKLHSEALAEFLWQRKEDGSTWEYVYFLDEITTHDIPVEEFNAAVGYAQNYVIQGFNVLDEEKSIAVLERFDLESSVYFPEISEDQYFDALDDEDSLDQTGSGTSRKEQGFLRKSLFGKNKYGQCCICARNFPVQFLVTAHIKKRARCTLAEKKDYRNIVAPMCKFGCDDLYEKRYIYVENGNIKLNSNSLWTEDLEAQITPLDGAKCLAYKPGNSVYFEWHRKKALG